MLVTTGSNPLTTYRAIFDGAGFNWLFPWVTGDERADAAANLQQTLIITTTLILTGLAVAFAFRCGLFNIGGQGQYIVGAVLAVWIGSSFSGHELAPAHPPRGDRRRALRRALGGYRRLPESDRRRPRGDLDDHAELDRDLDRRLPVRARRARSRTTPRTFVPISNDVVEGAKLPVFWGDPILQGLHVGLLRRDRRARRLLADPQPDDARLRRQGGRLQPRGGALRRHQRLAELLPRDGDLRRVRRPRGRGRRPRLAVPARDRRHPGRRRSPSSASRSRCSAATRPSASRSRRCSSAASSRARRPATSTPRSSSPSSRRT